MAEEARRQYVTVTMSLAKVSTLMEGIDNGHADSWEFHASDVHCGVPVLRAVVTVGMNNGWKFASANIPQAFLYASIEEGRQVYLRPPKICVDFGLVPGEFGTCRQKHENESKPVAHRQQLGPARTSLAALSARSLPRRSASETPCRAA
eukprot:4639355-Amphidinium_carterae.1